MAQNFPKCDTLADDTHNHLIECSLCKKWFHYKCTQMPIYFLIHLETTDNDFCCDSCVHDKNSATYPSRFNELSKIVRSFRINPATNTQVDNSNPSHDSTTSSQDSTTSSPIIPPSTPSTPSYKTSINIDINESPESETTNPRVYDINTERNQRVNNDRSRNTSNNIESISYKT